MKKLSEFKLETLPILKVPTRSGLSFQGRSLEEMNWETWARGSI
ncbi:MAG: hypothetical protein ACFB8W_07370 [Elainellaceae cyanobacterium]